ncbi:Abi family protein [Acrocarpospora macrocephala]|uniref:CAAX amino protease n=1 Tax=Acrocarpospora macrocephala TaxID=150177 RepID=A0A5M3WZA4_9ACTN|nr:Abi family protein [Acrocarpospora macrocephala]GES13746.1 hypothetical protein Amac_073430 [Acrocarpospora macrocephala]
MNPALDHAVELAISVERLRPYRAAFNGDRSTGLRLYAWNIEISTAFYGLLHCLEVVLRNAMHRELIAHFDREDWWHSPKLRLDLRSARAISDMEADLARSYATPTPGHMVAALTLGFWVNLMASTNNYETILWRPALHKSFPHYRGTRQPLHRDLYHLRLFRNRIAHHEAVHGRHLAADHASIIRVLGYLSPEATQWARKHDRVPEALARRADVCAALAPTRF